MASRISLGPQQVNEQPTALYTSAFLQRKLHCLCHELPHNRLVAAFSNSRSLGVLFVFIAANAPLNIIIVVGTPIMQDACLALLFTEFNEADIHIAKHLPVCFLTTFGCRVI